MGRLRSGSKLSKATRREKVFATVIVVVVVIENNNDNDNDNDYDDSVLDLFPTRDVFSREVVRRLESGDMQSREISLSCGYSNPGRTG
ncbi:MULTISPECIES: hypothetical protein [unclassified Thiocapsa]|uniref:hypothetical protein n=1 Tax=unclassified Thiocapsa TaxID=2641286 RepID=UPI0035B2D8A4